MIIDYNTLYALGCETCYTDHILHFKRLFECIKIKTFLEWGCGYSTKIFLENSEKVISVELAMDAVSDQWINECIGLFGNENWTPTYKPLSDACIEACCYLITKKQDYALVDDVYFKELDDYFKAILKENDVTVSFVDAGVLLRGDLAELSLQNKIPIVIAHDYNNSNSEIMTANHYAYGWFKIKEHSEYEQIYINYGCGTMFWIRKDFPEVIAAMKQYLNEWHGIVQDMEAKRLQGIQF